MNNRSMAFAEQTTKDLRPIYFFAAEARPQFSNGGSNKQGFPCPKGLNQSK